MAQAASKPSSKSEDHRRIAEGVALSIFPAVMLEQANKAGRIDHWSYESGNGDWQLITDKAVIVGTRDRVITKVKLARLLNSHAT